MRFTRKYIGTPKEAEKLFDEHNIKFYGYSKRVTIGQASYNYHNDVEVEYSITVTVDDDFIIPKVKTIKELSESLEKYKSQMEF